MREYFLHDPIHPKGGITINVMDDHDCVFCDHCIDVIWDYSNLIYALACDIECDPWERPCKYFVESEGDS